MAKLVLWILVISSVPFQILGSALVPAPAARPRRSLLPFNKPNFNGNFYPPNFDHRPNFDSSFNPQPSFDNGFYPRPNVNNGFYPQPNVDNGFYPQPNVDNGFNPQPNVDNGFYPQPNIDNGFYPQPNVDNGFYPQPNVDNGFYPQPNVDNGFYPQPNVDNGFYPQPNVDNGFYPQPNVNNGFYPQPNVDNGFNPQPNVDNGFYPQPNVDNGFYPQPNVDNGLYPQPNFDTNNGFNNNPSIFDSETENTFKSFEIENARRQMIEGRGGTTIVQYSNVAFLKRDGVTYQCLGRIIPQRPFCLGSLRKFQTVQPRDFCFSEMYTEIDNVICVATSEQNGLSISNVNGRLSCTGSDGRPGFLVSIPEYQRFCGRRPDEKNYVHFPDHRTPFHVELPNRNLGCLENRPDVCTLSFYDRPLGLGSSKALY